MFVSYLQHELGELFIAKERGLPVLSDLTGLWLGSDLCERGRERDQKQALKNMDGDRADGGLRQEGGAGV